jgi:hypothetical protein
MHALGKTFPAWMRLGSSPIPGVPFLIVMGHVNLVPNVQFGVTTKSAEFSDFGVGVPTANKKK